MLFPLPREDKNILEFFFAWSFSYSSDFDYLIIHVMAIPETRRTAPDGGDFADQLWKFQLRKEHAHLLQQYEDQCAAIEALENGNQEIITDANKRLQRRKEQEAKTKAMMDEMGAQLATLQKDIELLKEDLSKLSGMTI